MYDLIIEGQSTENNNHREQLIRDMIYVCLLPNLSQKNRREFIDVCISWSYSDRSESNITRSAKYKGCRYWSEEALKRIDDSGNWADAKKDRELRHEHIVPRGIFINAIDTYFESLRNEIRKNEGDINNIANRAFEDLSDKMKIMKGCVVTKHEAELIDGKIPGQKGYGIYRNDMPESAYNASKPRKEESWKLFNDITDEWARYKTELTKNIRIYELDWNFNEKSKQWETDKKAKKMLFRT